MVVGCADQILEMAQYIDARKGGQVLVSELEVLLEKGEKEEALKKIVDASVSLSTSPEKGTLYSRDVRYQSTPHVLILKPEIAEYIPAYNLLIHLIRSSPELPSLLPTILQNLSTPPPTSPHNGPALSIHALSTIFNVLPANSPLRYPVLRTTLGVVAEYGMYETLAPQLKNVEKWIGEWQSSAEETRDLYLAIAGIAEKSRDDEYVSRIFYHYPNVTIPETRPN